MPRGRHFLGETREAGEKEHADTKAVLPSWGEACREPRLAQRQHTAPSVPQAPGCKVTALDVPKARWDPVSGPKAAEADVEP